MNKKAPYLLVLVLLLLMGCAVNNAAPTVETPPAIVGATSPEPVEHKTTIYAPASTSSVPVVLAASKMKNIDLVLFTNQSQANTLFMRGDVSILVTGLSVGVEMYNNGAPIRQINSFVSGLSYLVTSGEPVGSFADLKGREIYLPFKGSPLEEVSIYFCQQSGLKWNEDVKPVYSPFESSVELLKQGKADNVLLPEPNVTLAEGKGKAKVTLSYFDEWNRLNPEDEGYPQVGALVQAEWAETHADEIKLFNQFLAEAIVSVQSDPQGAVEAVKSQYSIPSAVLQKSLGRTHYTMLINEGLQQTVNAYYQKIGKPLNEKFSAFFYRTDH